MGNHGHDFLDLENFIFVKSRENHQTMQNTAKFARNLIKYMSIQHFLKLSSLLGLFNCHNLANLS